MRTDLLVGWYDQAEARALELSAKTPLETKSARELGRLQRLLAMPREILGRVGEALSILRDSERFVDPGAFNFAIDVVRAAQRFAFGLNPACFTAPRSDLQDVLAPSPGPLPDPPVDAMRPLVEAILAGLEGSGVEVQLAAPTGRAARRLEEATGHEAQTIHRLLEWMPGREPGFRPGHPLPAGLAIVDEASMLNLRLIEVLLGGLAESTHVVLVGDALAVMPDVIARGSRFAVVFAADFAETGPEGEQRQQTLSDMVAGSDTRLLGPNTNMKGMT